MTDTKYVSATEAIGPLTTFLLSIMSRDTTHADAEAVARDVIEEATDGGSVPWGHRDYEWTHSALCGVASEYMGQFGEPSHD